MSGGIWARLQRHWTAEQRAAGEQQARQAEAAGMFRMKTTERGAATSVFLTASPQAQGIGGRYFEACDEAEVVEQLDGLHGVLPHALDPESARRLWDVPEQLLADARTATAVA